VAAMPHPLRRNLLSQVPKSDHRPARLVHPPRRPDPQLVPRPQRPRGRPRAAPAARRPRPPMGSARTRGETRRVTSAPRPPLHAHRLVRGLHPPHEVPSIHSLCAVPHDLPGRQRPLPPQQIHPRTTGSSAQASPAPERPAKHGGAVPAPTWPLDLDIDPQGSRPDGERQPRSPIPPQVRGLEAPPSAAGLQTHGQRIQSVQAKLTLRHPK
jgi:hypothetical protein